MAPRSNGLTRTLGNASDPITCHSDTKSSVKFPAPKSGHKEYVQGPEVMLLNPAIGEAVCGLSD